MTIQSPSRRLRLFILSLSLFACGVTAAQTTSPPVGPPGISVVETKLEKAQFFTRGVPTFADPVVDEKTGQRLLRVLSPNN
jgi:hypothetical protein